MLKKSCAIILSIALAMGILVHGSFAYSSAPEDNLTSLFTSLFYDDPYYDTNFSALHDFFSDYYDDSKNVTVAMVNSDTMYVIIHNGYLWDNGTFLRCNEAGSYYQIRLTDYTNPSYFTYTQGGGMSTGYFGYDWYNITTFNDLPSQSVIYTTARFYINAGLLSSSNLTLDGPFLPDQRYLSASRTDQYESGLPYLAIRVDDIPYSYCWVSVHFSDAYGPGTQIFDFYDMIYYPGDDFQMYLINPMDISPIEFTVDSVVYSGSLDWGYKELSGLDITFNEPLLPDPVPSVTPVPDYNYFDTSIINYNGGQKDIFYNSFQVYIQRYEGPNSSEFYFKDREGYLIQPFAFNYILLPYYSVQQGFVYDEFIDDCFYQYDVILSEYYDAYFDFFYGSGALTSLQYALQNSAPGDDISSILERWYANHDPIVFTFPYDGDPDGILNKVGVDMPALMVITDSFYFKQTNYLLGDTGTILSEFSDRFYKVDGFVDNLFGNMLSSYNLDLAYYENASRSLTSLSYWLNDNSLDNLSYLVNIDTDLHELLEWFQNQEDPDVLLALPYFNPSLLEDLYGLNIGELIQFFNSFVQTLPSFDYSDFPDFFDYADDVVADIAGAGNSIVDVILDPYEYDDSGLSTFGWD